MKKSAAYMINENILLQAMSLTETGLWIAYGKVLSVRTDDHSELAAAIIKHWQTQSKMWHIPQSQWKDVQRPILEAAGVKTWAALGKKGEGSRNRTLGRRSIDGSDG